MEVGVGAVVVGWVGEEDEFLKKKIFGIFLMELTCGTQSTSANNATSPLTDRSDPSDLVSIRSQFAISANCKKLVENSWFFAIET
jgi:hypothetical protein